MSKLIPLSRGAFAIVDDDDFEELSQYRWHLATTGYPRRDGGKVDGKKRIVSMHRQVLGLEHGDPRQGDHLDRNRLNCRRENLRICTPSENQCNKSFYSNNSSGFKGVSFNRIRENWQVHISAKGRRIGRGGFATAEDASEFYGLLVDMLHGSFGRLA
jgi:hypothetical protein